jgi:hypothetical protein
LANDQEKAFTWSDDEPLRSEPRGFSPEQMVTCETCLRANPPTRTACLYCGAGLPVSDSTDLLRNLQLRQPETWEQGFNVILIPIDGDLSSDTLRTVATLLKIEVETVERILTGGEPFPVTRATSEDDVAVIARQLGSLGVNVISVADRELDAYSPVRVRAMEFSEDELVLHPVGVPGGVRVPWSELILFVAGRRTVRKLEYAERQAKKKEKEIVDSHETSADEQRLDFYTAEDKSGWRIAVDNFDFSCLGPAKTLIAATNFQTLTATLRKRAAGAIYDDSYQRTRHLLTEVWPLDEQTASLGLRKQRIGRVDIAAMTTTDNDTQFTRYSRLRHYFVRRQMDATV